MNKDLISVLSSSKCILILSPESAPVFFHPTLRFELKHLFLFFCFSSLIICCPLFAVSLYSLQTRLEFPQVCTMLFPALERRQRK